MEGCTDLYRLGSGTLTAIGRNPWMHCHTLGFLPVHNDVRPYMARVSRQFIEKELIPLTGPHAHLT